MTGKEFVKLCHDEKESILASYFADNGESEVSAIIKRLIQAGISRDELYRLVNTVMTDILTITKAFHVICPMTPIRIRICSHVWWEWMGIVFWCPSIRVFKIIDDFIRVYNSFHNSHIQYCYRIILALFFTFFFVVAFVS